MVYIVISRTARTRKREYVSKTKNIIINNIKNKIIAIITTLFLSIIRIVANYHCHH